MLKNCELCNRVFAHPSRRLCEDCYRTAQQAFESVKAFLEENPGSTVAEVAEATDVNVETIYDYIKEGRLSVVPKDARLTCQICGEAIENGRICASCRAEFRGGSKAAAGVEEAESKSSRMHYLDEIRKRRR